jgi:hypothetical protein
MAGVATISLHDAGCRLAALHGSRERVACGKLLGLLKMGEIKAGFQFRTGRTLSWITIPAHHWAAKVSSDKFKMIRYSKNIRKSGALTVRLGDFPEEVVDQVNEAPGHEQASSDKWKAVLAVTSHRYEVAILEADWIAYEKQNPPSEPKPKKKSTSGRRQKTGWRDLSVIIGAYIIKHYQETHEHIKIEEASKNIHRLAEADEIPDLPAAPTIKGVLSKIRAKAEEISIK